LRKKKWALKTELFPPRVQTPRGGAEPKIINPNAKPKCAIGIDLGNTTCCVAVARNGQVLRNL